MLVSEAHLDPRESPRALQRAFATGVEQARRKRRPILVSVTLPAPTLDPIHFFENGSAVDATRLFWSTPDDRLTLVGVGTAFGVTGHGKDRFPEAKRTWEALLADAYTESPVNIPGTGPMVMGGFSFDPDMPAGASWEGFSDALLTLPSFLLTTASSLPEKLGTRGETAWFTVNAMVDPESDPEEGVAAALRAQGRLWEEAGDRTTTYPAMFDAPQLTTEDIRPAEWRRAVAALASDVRAGHLEKGVLARRVQAHAPRRFSVGDALRKLQSNYPECRLFAVARGQKCFIGATPERLVRLRGGKVTAMGLAGSIARGSTAAEDRRLGEALLASAKNGAEHAVVVHMLRDALSQVCLDVASPDRPSLLKLPNVQHLHTPVTARLRADCTLLDAVERLHPTPAVGGFPRELALEWIREHEGLDRGWYAGPIGWMSPGGDGEFAVAIRSALLDGETASVFAGCGIVADSTPDAEYEESRWKLRPMLAALSAAARPEGPPRGTAR